MSQLQCWGSLRGGVERGRQGIFRIHCSLNSRNSQPKLKTGFQTHSSTLCATVRLVSRNRKKKSVFSLLSFLFHPEMGRDHLFWAMGVGKNIIFKVTGPRHHGREGWFNVRTFYWGHGTRIIKAASLHWTFTVWLIYSLMPFDDPEKLLLIITVPILQMKRMRLKQVKKLDQSCNSALLEWIQRLP